MTEFEQRRRFSTTTILTLLAGTAVIVYLVAAHPQHVLGVLPVLVLLACPLMHLLVHGGRHHHG